MEQFSEQQIEQLAPDHNLKNARSLVQTGKWPTLGVSDRAMWGECKGSGKKPYQVAIDGNNLAFKCTCPSRKFPCKHALGLMLMYASFEGSFNKVADGSEADFVKEWLDKRAERAQKQEQKASESAKKPVDAKAKARRQASRNAKIIDGLDLLDQWLLDVARTGIAQGVAAENAIYQGARALVPRLVDAQAPALSRMVDSLLADAVLLRNNTQNCTDFFGKLSDIYLISQAYRQYDNLSAEWQAELRRLVGINESRDEICANAGIEDEWLVLDDKVTKEDRITTHAYVAYGLNSQHFVYIFVFVPKNVLVNEVYMVGSLYKGVMHCYPSVSSIKRAIFVASETDKAKVGLLSDKDNSLTSSQAKIDPPSFANFQELFQAKSSYFAENPFALSLPVFVANVRFAISGAEGFEQWYVVDVDGQALALDEDVAEEIKNKSFIARSLGHPFVAFMLISKDKLDVRGILIGGRYYGK